MVVRVPPIVHLEIGVEFTECDLVSDGTTTNRDPDQNEAAHEPKLLQFSYEEQYRSFLEGLSRDSDPDGLFGESVDRIPPDGKEGVYPKVTKEAIKSTMGEEGASPKAGLKIAKWSLEILVLSILELSAFRKGKTQLLTCISMQNSSQTLAERIQITTHGVRSDDDYWRTVFGVQSAVDERLVPREEGHDYCLIEPLSAEDVDRAMRNAGSTVPGLDKVSVADFKSLELTVIAQLFNLMMVLECHTASLATARLTLVPKASVPSTPSDYRPVAVSSILLRALHKVLAKRRRSRLTLSSFQVEFQKRDGCLEASYVLQCVLRRVQFDCLNAANAKAFDTVSGDNIIRAAAAHRVPPELQLYLRSLYTPQSGFLATKCWIVTEV
ncbi:unnamed protein product [Dicrocoelium dendriticum]|nr:unnamed protein product [Dicrocoelium dendriticum]